MAMKDLTPWNWFSKDEKTHPISKLQHDIDQVFSKFFHNFERALPTDDKLRSRATMQVTPSLDIIEQHDRYIISLEVPGVEKSDIDIRITEENNLVISGEKKFSDEKKKDNYHSIERSYGSFKRMISLPSNCNAEDIEANFHNGVLELTIKKDLGKERASKKITIK